MRRLLSLIIVIVIAWTIYLLIQKQLSPGRQQFSSNHLYDRLSQVNEGNRIGAPYTDRCFAPDGQALAEGETILMYKRDSLRSTCQSLTKTCLDGELTAPNETHLDYTLTSCPRPTIYPPALQDITCNLDGNEYPVGSQLITYRSPRATVDQDCQQVLTSCNGNGERVSLEGQKVSQDCTYLQTVSQSFLDQHNSLVDPTTNSIDVATLSPGPQGSSCQTPWGEIVAHGESIISFNQAQADFDQICSARYSICDNGGRLLDLKPYPHPSCEMIAPQPCTTNGMIIPHATQRTRYNQDCQPVSRYCFDGLLDGDDTHSRLSCDQAVTTGQDEEPETVPVMPTDSPLVDQQTPPNQGPSVDTTSTETVSSSPTNVDYPRPSGRPPNCSAPYGGPDRVHGQAGEVYLYEQAYPTQGCEPVSVVCGRGELRFGRPAAIGEVISQDTFYTSCTPLPGRDCETPRGASIEHGESVTAYREEVAPYGKQCLPQIRTCFDGTLDGTFTQATCVVADPASCDSSCGPIQHGEQVTTYTLNPIPHGNGQVCGDVAVVSSCTDGTLDPAPGEHCSCSIGDPESCTGPDGSNVDHLDTLTLYGDGVESDGMIQCPQETRQCFNGTFVNEQGDPESFRYDNTICTLPDNQ